MGEFIFNRGTSRAHSYPEPRRGATSPQLARNFAVGPSSQDPVPTTGVQVVWALIESGAPPSVDVPITPIATGIIRIAGVISVKNSSGVPVGVGVQVQIDGVLLFFPLAESVTVDPAGLDGPGAEAIPILAEATVPVGSTSNVEILVTADGLDDTAIALALESSSLDIQEMSLATG